MNSLTAVLLFLHIFCYAFDFSIAKPPHFINPRKRCPPKPQTIKEFDIPQYLGDWYEIQRIPAFFQLGTSCVKATYGVSDSENPVSVHNVATSALGTFTDITGTAYVPDPQYPGELKVEFPGNPAGDYWVLETDYTNYSLVYACQDFLLGAIRLEFGWILARNTTMDPTRQQQLIDVFDSFNIDVSQFEVTYQGEDCVYDPSY